MDVANEKIKSTNVCKKCGLVLLIPYENQVSGHHKVMLYDEATICKPVMAKEYEFYKTFPPVLQRFIPKFKGIARAFAETDASGVVRMFASKLSADQNECDVEKTQDMSCKECSKEERFSSGSRNGNIMEKCQWRVSGKDEVVYGSNPWVMKVQKLSFEQNMYKSMNSKFILLENIGQKFQRPCILDLKMGTRQHGDHATVRKIKDHEERCQQSTSKSLGVRLCGMQVYDPATSCYSYTDKYSGRDLDPTGFIESLTAFLRDGKRSDVLGPMIKLLEEQHQIVEKLDSYRFFGCSLLLMYEGAVCAKSDEFIEVRMIDFSQVTLSGENREHDGPDVGYLFGLRNLTSMLRNIEANSAGIT